MRPLIAFFTAVALLSGVAPSAAQTRAVEAPETDKPQPRPGLFDEPRFISKAIDQFDARVPSGRGDPKDGFFIEAGDMITGSGFLAAGPGYRRHVFDRRAIVTASGALSVRLYGMLQANIQFPHLANDRLMLGAQTLFRDALQVNYFGPGNESLETERSGYRLTTSDTMAFAMVGSPALSLRARVGWLAPMSVGPMGGRDASYPDTVEIFAGRDIPGLTTRTSFLHADVALIADSRDYSGHPTRGGLYQLAWSGYNDRRTGAHSFQRYEAEASHYIPLLSEKWVLAVHGMAILSHAADGHTVPFYLTPSLGGRNLRGFADYRFHDANMQAYSVESRWAVFSHVDVAAFGDFGNVAPTRSALGKAGLNQSYGAGIRLHNNRLTIARFDVAHGREGWRFWFKMNDPFRRSTESNGWRPAAPFVP